MAAPVAARQTAQAQRTDPQRAAARPARQGAMPARAGIDHLQRVLGNRGMYHLLRSGAIQAKLAVGPADDEYEREADRVADEIMRMPEPASRLTAQRTPPRVQRVCSECEEQAQRSPLPIPGACQECEELQPKSSATTLSGPEQISRKCPEGEEKACRQRQEGDAVQRKSDPTGEKDEDEEGIAQAKSRRGDPPEPSSELTSYVASSRGGGQPLPRSTREHFEARFGHDFSGVRVHTEPLRERRGRDQLLRLRDWFRHSLRCRTFPAWYSAGRPPPGPRADAHHPADRRPAATDGGQPRDASSSPGRT